jgi:hypothetical protein
MKPPLRHDAAPEMDRFVVCAGALLKYASALEFYHRDTENTEATLYALCASVVKFQVITSLFLYF